jgi:hypothetical protein
MTTASPTLISSEQFLPERGEARSQELQEFRSYRRKMSARWVELDAISKTPRAQARSGPQFCNS